MLVLGLIALSGNIQAQENYSESPVASRLAERQDRYRQRWQRLIPRYSKIQFAGGMGVISAGVGWDYGKKKQWETDLFIGFVPKFSADKATGSFTIKQNYIPWRVGLGGRWSLEPLTTGLYANKLTSRNFWGREPEKYGGPYYRFATNTRFSIFAGQRITYNLGHRHRRQAITAFYEFSSNDLYLVSAFTNSSLDLDDILVLSFGVKFQFL